MLQLGMALGLYPIDDAKPTPVVPVIPLLSQAPKMAFGLRTLTPAYSGPLIKVRRSSDNATLDVYADLYGRLNTATLTAFVGSNSGYITQWYDQSGNANHVAQASLPAQPRIILNGRMEDQKGIAGRPHLNFGINNASLFNAINPTAPSTVNVWGTLFQTGGNLIGSRADIAISAYVVNRKMSLKAGNNTQQGPQIGDYQPFSMTWQIPSAVEGLTNFVHSANGKRVSATQNALPAWNGFQIGGYGNSGGLGPVSGFNGQLDEVLFFDKYLSTDDIAIIEGNQQDYWQGYQFTEVDESWVWDGDSITAGNSTTTRQDASRCADSLKATSGRGIFAYNNGSSGATGLNRMVNTSGYDSYVFPTSIVKYNYMCGTNDITALYNGNLVTAIPYTYSNIRQAIAARKQSGIFKQINVGTLLPRAAPYGPVCLAVSDLVRAGMVAGGDMRGVGADYVLDFNQSSRFNDVADSADTNYFAPDALHPNDNGYLEMSRYDVAVLNQPVPTSDQSYSWSATAATTAWATGANWETGTAPEDDTLTRIAYFKQASYANQPDCGSRSVSMVLIGDGLNACAGVTLSGTLLTLAEGGIGQRALAGASTIGVTAINMTKSMFISNWSANALTVNSNISNPDSIQHTLTLGGQGTGGVTVNGVLADGAGKMDLQVYGSTACPVTLNGDNTFTKGIVVFAGKIVLGHANAVGTGALDMRGGSTLDANTPLTLNNPVVKLNSTVTFTGSNALNLGTGNVVLGNNSGVTVQGASITFDGVISGAYSFNPGGTSVAYKVFLNGNNTFSGGLNTSNCTTVLGHNNAAGTGTITTGASTFDASAAGLVLPNAVSVTGNFTFTGTNSLAINGNTALTANRNVTVSANTLTLNTTSGAWTLNKLGAGVLKYSGASTLTNSTVNGAGGELQINSTHSGTATVTAGKLSGTGAISGAVSVANATTAILQGGTGAGNTGTLSTGALTFSGANARLNVNTNGTTLASKVAVTGNVAAGGMGVIISGALNVGTYDLITCTGTMSGAVPTVVTNGSGRTAALSIVTSNTLRLTLT